jgi:hypothetical protein
MSLGSKIIPLCLSSLLLNKPFWIPIQFKACFSDMIGTVTVGALLLLEILDLRDTDGGQELMKVISRTIGRG